MIRPIALADEDDFINRYQSGVSLKQLSKEFGVSRPALQRILRLRGIAIRNRSDGMRARWIKERASGDWRERLMRRAWESADAVNDDLERKVVSMYRSGLISQAAIARRLGISKPTVGGILRKNGIRLDKRPARRAEGKVGGFCRQNQCAVETDFANLFMHHGLEFIHQGRVGTRNLDFVFPACRVAVEIVRRHWRDAKSLRRERLEEIFSQGWRLLIIYDPAKSGIDMGACAKQLVACLDFARRNPSAPGQYWVIGRDGQFAPAARVQLYDFAAIEETIPEAGIRP
jgi:very-short-patch-repair endonuclease/DNA-binding CsgD family transcriptional regulator